MSRSTTAVPARCLAVALLLAMGGCGDESEEEALCHDTADKICPKWFSCHKTFSQALWPQGLSQCKAGVQAWCGSADAFTGCNIDNDKLRKCKNGIDGAACNSVPPQCQEILICYGKNK